MSRVFILTLPEGVRREDVQCVEDQFDEKLAGKVKDVPEIDEVFDALPRTFTGLDGWPLRTNLLCSVCGLEVPGRPIPIPCSMRRRDGQVEFVVEQIACAFPCGAVAVKDSWDGRELLSHIYFEFTGQRRHVIDPGPARLERRCFGGPLTTRAFQQRIHEADTSGLYPSPDQIVQERDRASKKLNTADPQKQAP